jgi:hypothetical protein
VNLRILNELDRILKNNPTLTTNNQSLCQVINGVFNIALGSVDVSNIYKLADTIDNAVLHNYFSNVWQAETKKYKYSGLSIIDEVNALNPRNVVDLGCGFNEFKGKIDNLIGVDPYNKKADISSSILDYRSSEKFDVAICLGSINFGSSDKVIAELTSAVNLVTDGGLLYFRVNPGTQHEAPESKWINFYDWDPVFVSNIAEHLNCELVVLRQDLNRLYFVLRKR